MPPVTRAQGARCLVLSTGGVFQPRGWRCWVQEGCPASEGSHRADVPQAGDCCFLLRS